MDAAWGAGNEGDYGVGVLLFLRLSRSLSVCLFVPWATNVISRARDSRCDFVF